MCVCVGKSCFIAVINNNQVALGSFIEVNKIVISDTGLRFLIFFFYHFAATDIIKCIRIIAYNSQNAQMAVWNS